MPQEILYRRNVVREALLAGRRKIYRLIVERGANRAELADILQAADRRGVTVIEQDKHAMNTLSNGVHHQGVIIETGAYPYTGLADALALARQRNEPPFLVALDLVHDPRNVGALLRSAAAAGAHGVITQEMRAGEITPTVVTTSAGMAERLYIARVTNIARTLKDLKTQDIWVAGLGLSADAFDYASAPLSGALALVIGNEGAGLRRLVRETCDIMVQIPMAEGVESLNAAVAGSVVMFKVAEGRRGRPEGAK